MVSTVDSFSIVVPTLNRANLLKECLESLVVQTFPRRRFEILVVDNGSQDNTRQVAHTASRSAGATVRYVSEETRGINRARNAGLNVAEGDVICFVDDDELVPQSWLQLVAEELTPSRGVDGVGGPYRYHGRFPGRLCTRCSSVDGHELRGERGPVPALLGGNMAIRRTAFGRVGTFDPGLSGAGDETEWFMRATRADLSFVYDPALWVWHRSDVRSPTALMKKSFHQGRTLARLVREQGRHRTYLAGWVRPLGHALTRRCWGGVFPAARQLGAVFQECVDLMTTLTGKGNF